MSMYHMMNGVDPNAGYFLHILGLDPSKIERLRDAHYSEGKIVVITRTGGGNREDYPNEYLRSNKFWERDEDDSFDSTYAYDYFSIPDEYKEEIVAALGDTKMLTMKEKTEAALAAMDGE